MARSRGSNATLVGAFETVYGTPPTTGFYSLPFVSGNPGEEQGLIADDLLGTGREPQPPSLDVINNVFDLALPVDLRNMGFWLNLLLGASTDTGSAAPYSHVFNSGALALPAAALQLGHPEVPSYGMNFGVRANTLTVNMARSGLLSCSMGFIAKGETKTTTPATGTATPTNTLPVKRFSQFQGAVLRGGTALGNVETASFVFSNNLDPVNTITGDGRIADADPGKVTGSGSLGVRFADTVLLTQAQSGAPVDLEFGWTIDASNSLLFRFNSVYLPRAKQPVTGPNGIVATFPWQAARDPSTGITMIATLVNDVASYV